MKLKGGMGNQMFQYAFGLKLKQELQTNQKLDLTSLLDRSKGADFVYRDYDLTAFNVAHDFLWKPGFLKACYKIKSRRLAKIISRLASSGKDYIKEKQFHYQADLLDQPADNTIYDGWWQSPKYFAGVEDEVRAHFTFSHELIPESKELQAHIKSTNAICLNVRRTDFLQVDNLNTTSKAYFLRAVKRMAELVNEPTFFIFSDDVKWCSEELKLDYPFKVVDHSHKGFKFSNYMQLMTACKHYIIPNSSYAWWAIWLNEQKNKKVIAPAKWFNDPEINTTDLVPQEWIRL